MGFNSGFKALIPPIRVLPSGCAMLNFFCCTYGVVHVYIYIQDTRRYCAYIFMLFATVQLITTLKLLHKLQALFTISY